MRYAVQAQGHGHGGGDRADANGIRAPKPQCRTCGCENEGDAEDVIDDFKAGDQTHLPVDRGKKLLHGLFGIERFALVMREQLDRGDVAVGVRNPATHEAACVGLRTGCTAKTGNKIHERQDIQNQPAEERQQQLPVKTAGDQGHGQEVDHDEHQDVGYDHDRIAHGEGGLHHLGRDASGEFILKKGHALAQQMPVEVPAQTHGKVAVQGLVFHQRLCGNEQWAGQQHGSQQNNVALFLLPQQMRRHFAQPLHDIAEHGKQEGFKSSDQGRQNRQQQDQTANALCGAPDEREEAFRGLIRRTIRERGDEAFEPGKHAMTVRYADLQSIACRSREVWSLAIGCKQSQHLMCNSVYFIVGMLNSAPARMPVGQRAVMVFKRV